MQIIGYSVFKFTGNQDNKQHDCLTVQLADFKEDETHQGYYKVIKCNFIDKSKEFYQLISKYYKEGTDLDCLYNEYGKVKEILVKK